MLFSFGYVWVAAMKAPILFLLFLVSAALLRAEIRLGSPFGDYMVLQRGKPVPVWGWAAPGEKIGVSFGGQEREADADRNGRWQVTLATMEASAEPRDLHVWSRHTGEAIALKRVLVGEVWLCGGQSNMERQLGPRSGQKEIVNWKEEARTADYPLIRELYVEQTRSLQPQETVSAHWRVCTPESVIDFTAVGFFFARALHEHLGVPVGIIHSSWGGTPAEAWTSEEGLSAFPGYVDQVERLRAFASDPEGANRAYEKDLSAWYVKNDPGTQGELWKAGAADSVSWEPMELPAMWEDSGYSGVDGVGWFRKQVELPKKWRGKELFLELGAIDDVDTTWVNGYKVGTTSGWQTPREYRVGVEQTVSGTLTIMVRVLDTGGGGGIWNKDTPLRISLADGSGSPIALGGAWDFHLSKQLGGGSWPPQNVADSPGAPTVMYNAMIAPLVPYAMRGVTFYQGEANAGKAKEYERLLPALIENWRTLWGEEPLPFLYVQIAPFEGQPPEIREAQRLAELATINTAMVVTIDVGDAKDIHPTNKRPVGERLALAARALAYDETVTYRGPVFAGWQAQGNVARIGFMSTGETLVAKGGDLYGFEVAGEDGTFHEATARIEGMSVLLESPEVAKPTAVRYGWANVASGNLFNEAGLPASPFRSEGAMAE